MATNPVRGAVPLVHKPETVLLIHGTFVPRKDDAGDAWWQLPLPGVSAKTRSFAAYLEKHSNGSLSGKPYHWSGRNSEAARRIDAKALLEELRSLDKKGPFHIVAHSHGGLVTWLALKLSMKGKGPFSNLKSWTTVGTPFLDFSSSRFDIVPAVCALVLLVAALAGLPYFLDTLDSVRMAQALAPVWFYLWVVLAFLYSILCLATALLALRPMLNFMVFAAQRKKEEAATQTYHSRWLGIAHENDEAISALSASTKAGPEIFAQDRLLAAQNTESVPEGVKSRFWNALVDQILWKLAIRTRAQGSDLGSAEIYAAGSQPDLFPKFPEELRFLPAELSKAMIAKSKSLMGASADAIRSSLIHSYRARSIRSLIASAGEDFDSRVLLHTGYFDQPAVRLIVRAWIAKGRGEAAEPFLRKLDPESRVWVEKHFNRKTPPRHGLSQLFLPAPRARKLWLYEFAASATTGGACVLIAIAMFALWTVTVRPVIMQYQIEAIAQTAMQSELLNNGESQEASDLIFALAARGEIRSLSDVFDLIRDHGQLRRVTKDAVIFYDDFVGTELRIKEVQDYRTAKGITDDEEDVAPSTAGTESLELDEPLTLFPSDLALTREEFNALSPLPDWLAKNFASRFDDGALLLKRLPQAPIGKMDYCRTKLKAVGATLRAIYLGSVARGYPRRSLNSIDSALAYYADALSQRCNKPLYADDVVGAYMLSTGLGHRALNTKLKTLVYNHRSGLKSPISKALLDQDHKINSNTVRLIASLPPEFEDQILVYRLAARFLRQRPELSRGFASILTEKAQQCDKVSEMMAVFLIGASRNMQPDSRQQTLEKIVDCVLAMKNPASILWRASRLCLRHPGTKRQSTMAYWECPVQFSSPMTRASSPVTPKDF